jgi:RimJ/RimL family protein N-acetyltransferase
VSQFPLAPELPEKVLALRENLPFKPETLSLRGRFVHLEPLDVERDTGPLFEVSNGQPASLGLRRIDAYSAEELIWRFLWYGPFLSLGEMAAYLHELCEAPGLRAFCVFDAESGHQAGVTTYVNNSPEHLKIELGHIWFSPLLQRTNANVESAYLMLKNAFELGYRRLEWKCDALNERSRRSALRIGFKLEGIQEAHLIIKNRNRDTAWYRMLDHEWPTVRVRLEEMLYG